MRLEQGDMWSVYDRADLFLVTTNSTLTKSGKLVMSAGIARQARTHSSAVTLRRTMNTYTLNLLLSSVGIPLAAVALAYASMLGAALAARCEGPSPEPTRYPLATLLTTLVVVPISFAVLTSAIRPTSQYTGAVRQLVRAETQAGTVTMLQLDDTVLYVRIPPGTLQKGEHVTVYRYGGSVKRARVCEDGGCYRLADSLWFGA